MKRLILFLIFTIAAFFAVSCQKESGSQDNKEKLVFSTIKVGVEDGGMTSDDPGTKSLINADTEEFYDAYIFAFDASSKKILNYEDGTPVSVYTTSKSFEWSLPVGTAMDVWVVANAGTGNTWKSTLESALSNANLAESDLYGDNLMFTCANGSSLAAMEHMPMAGMMNNVTLANSSDVLNLRIKRLFARYDIRIDTGDYPGYTVKSLFISSSKSNTEVPFFYDGNYKQTYASKLAIVDRATEAQLVEFENEQYVTLYFLENCQGTILKSGDVPATSWKTVYDELGSAVALCSYVEIGINLSSSNTGEDESTITRIYLSDSDFKSNFDVKRNIYRRIKLTLSNTEGFKFTNPSPVILQPGGSQPVAFETSIDIEHIDDIDFVFLGKDNNPTSNLSINGKPTLTTNSTNVTTYGYQGSVTVKASSSATDGLYSVLGGNDRVHDKLPIEIHSLIDNTITLYSGVVRSDNKIDVVVKYEYDVLIPITVSCMIQMNNNQTLNCNFILPPHASGMYTPQFGVEFVTDNDQYNKIVAAGGVKKTFYSTLLGGAGSHKDGTYNYIISGTCSLSIGSTTPPTTNPYSLNLQFTQKKRNVSSGSYDHEYTLAVNSNLNTGTFHRWTASEIRQYIAYLVVEEMSSGNPTGRFYNLVPLNKSAVSPNPGTSYDTCTYYDKCTLLNGSFVDTPGANQPYWYCNAFAKNTDLQVRSIVFYSLHKSMTDKCDITITNIYNND